MDDLPVQSTPEVRCPVSCHYRSTRIQLQDSYYCMMIDFDPTAKAPLVSSRVKRLAPTASAGVPATRSWAVALRVRASIGG